jgi:glycosyltransferase involved in cell wall biosynthesis
MKIGIDARLALYEPHGIPRYVIYLLRELAKIDSINSYILYLDKQDTDEVLPNRFEKKVLSPSNYALWEQYALPQAVRRDKVDILHCPGNTGPLFFDFSIKLVMTIHDLMFMDNDNADLRPGNMYQRFGKFYRKSVVSNVIKKASAIMTDSQYSFSEFKRYFSSLQTPVSVVHLGCEFPDYRDVIASTVFKKYNIERSFILSFGGIAPRKNTKRVIELYSQVRKKNNVQLVITGIPNSNRGEYEKLSLQLGVEKDIIFLSLIPEWELVVLLQNAALFLFLSKYEGFGLPVLEAMSAGVPVIASNRTSIPELVGDEGIVVNPDDDNDVIKSIFYLLQISEMDRKRICENNKNWSKNFSWNKTAKQVLSVYNSVGSK